MVPTTAMVAMAATATLVITSCEAPASFCFRSVAYEDLVWNRCNAQHLGLEQDDLPVHHVRECLVDNNTYRGFFDTETVGMCA